MDCPKCGRANVTGYKKEEKQSKYLKGGAVGYGVVMGGLLGGPIGVAVGAGLGKMAGGMIADSAEGDLIEFQFQCPKCGYRWTKYFEK